MSTPPATDQPDRPGEQLEAVRVLTAAGRLCRPTLPRTATAERPADPAPTLIGGEQRADWAEFVTLVLAGAAANLGGVEAALAGRPGSWEADHVRALLRGTVGDDETQLLRHRTEPPHARPPAQERGPARASGAARPWPTLTSARAKYRCRSVIVHVHVDQLLVDLGVCAAFEDAQDELARHAQTLAHSTPPGQGSVGPDSRQQQERQAEELDALQDRLWALHEQDAAAYAAALQASIETVAAALPNLRAPVVVTVDLDPVRPDSAPDPRGAADPVAERLLQAGIRATPLPGAGQLPLQRLHGDGAPSEE